MLPSLYLSTCFLQLLVICYRNGFALRAVRNLVEYAFQQRPNDSPQASAENQKFEVNPSRGG